MTDTLNFIKASKKGDYKSIYEHNLDVFSDSPDFEWTFEDIKKEVQDGWELFSVMSGQIIIAALFFRQDDDCLLTKNTALKMDFQGAGHSHRIKEFFEKEARERGLGRIYHYCGIDNFRMYSLNESHGYRKTDRKLGPGGTVVEWMKLLK